MNSDHVASPSNYYRASNLYDENIIAQYRCQFIN